jgi:hypothetical protein
MEAVNAHGGLLMLHEQVFAGQIMTLTTCGVRRDYVHGDRHNLRHE